MKNYKIFLVIVIVIIAFICFLVFFNNIFPGNNYFNRLNLKKSGKVKSALKESRTIHSIDGKNKYFYIKKNNTTYRAEYFKINGEKIIELNSKLKGDLNLYFEIKNISNSENTIKFAIEKKSKKKRDILLDNIQVKEKTIIIEKISLKEDEDIYLKLSGYGDILLTLPVFYIEDIEDKNKKYIFLISIDTLRADHLGVYGYKRNISPNMDEFSRDSVVFNNCYSPCSWTLPSHVSILTGLNVFNHKVYNRNHKIPGEITLLSDIFINKSINFSFNNGVFVNYIYGFYKGFDFYKTQGWTNSSKRIFKNTINFLKKINSPFIFSFLHTYQVHSPYKVHRGLHFSEKLIEKKYPKRFSMLRALGNSKNFLYKPLSKETKEKIINFYDAEIEYFDQWFGYFIEELKKLKIYNNSLIIICSDHGEEFYSHKGWGHGHSLYNEAIRVPLIIKFPGQKYRGKKIDENVSLIDISPTILDYYNIKFSKKLDGMSLLDCINGKTGNFVDRKIISVLKRNFQKKIISPVPEKISIVYKNFKLIYNYKYSKQTEAFFSEYPPPLFKEYEFYNLSTDFAEKNNLAYNAKFSKIIERLKTEINKTKKKIEKSINPLLIKYSKEDLEKIKALGYL